MKATPEKIKTRLRVKDEVIVISGKHKKERGEILRINRENLQITVKGVNLRKRFTRPSQENPKGGIVEIEMPIALSNVQYYDSKEKKQTRIAFVADKNGAKARFSVASKRKRALD